MDVHAGVDFIYLTRFEIDLFNTVEVKCGRFIGVSCGDSCFIMNEVCGGVFEVIGYVGMV